MAKKYLLYIHNERFSDEQKKSELVNDLLAEYYAEPTVKVNIPPPINKTVTIPPSKVENGLCKLHALPLTDWGRCLQKGCKYA